MVDRGLAINPHKTAESRLRTVRDPGGGLPSSGTCVCNHLPLLSVINEGLVTMTAILS